MTSIIKFVEKRQYFHITLCIIFILVAVAAGCITDTATCSGIPSPKPEVSPYFMMGRTAIKESSISINGTSKLPNGTSLQTELYKSKKEGYGPDKPEGWWPCDQHIIVENGSFQIVVDLRKYGGHIYLSDYQYWFQMWQTDNLSVNGVYPILYSLPSPEPKQK